MSLVDILEVSGYVVGGLSLAFTGAVGILQGKYNYENALQFYNEAPQDIKEIVGAPSKPRMYAQSLITSPRFMVYVFGGKEPDSAFTKYVSKIEKERGKEFMKLYLIGQLLKGKSNSK